MNMHILLFVALTGLAHAGGTDVGGGGDWVNINNRPALRDLVDNTTCLWKSGKDFADSIPQYDLILQSIEDTHWNLASNIERATNALKICVTASELKNLPTEDEASVTIFKQQKKQLAIRINNLVFISGPVFNQLPAKEKAYLLLHETLHEFIPMTVERRNQKLRSFVYAIHENQDKRMTPEAFALQIDANNVEVVRTSLVSDEIKKNLNLYYKNHDLLALQSVDELFLSSKKNWESIISSQEYKQIRKDLIQFQKPLFDAIESGRIADVQAALKSGISVNSIGFYKILSGGLILFNIPKYTDLRFESEMKLNSASLNRIWGDNEAFSFYQDPVTKNEIVVRSPFHSPSALMYAILLGGRLDIVKLLLSHPDIDPNNGFDYLTEDNLVYPDVLNQNNLGQSVHDPLQKTSTPLQQAVVSGSQAFVEALLSHPKTDVNAKDALGNTALHYAVFGKPEITRLLLMSNQIDVNADGNPFQQTPLFQLVNSCMRLVNGTNEAFNQNLDLLLDSPKVKKSKGNRFGITPYHVASDLSAHPYYGKQDPCLYAEKKLR